MLFNLTSWHVCPQLVLASVVPLDPRAWGLPCLIWTSLNIRSFFHLDLSSLATQSLWDCLLCSHTQIFCVLPVISGAEDRGWKDPQKPVHGLSWVCMHMLGGEREGEKQSIPKCQCVGRQKMEIHGETTRNWPISWPFLWTEWRKLGFLGHVLTCLTDCT